MIDSSRQYRQDELPSEIFNSGNGDVRNFNGQQVHVIVNNNGTRSFQPVTANETAIQNAQQAQQMQIQANQPAIQTLETQYNPDTGGGALVDRYKALVDSITSAEQPAVDVATKGVNAALAARGIVSSNQGIGNDTLQQVINPLTTQFGQLKAQTGLSEQQDLGQLASTIAGLKAGNVGNALSYAGGLSQAQTSAQASEQNAVTQANAAIAQQRLANQFQNVAPGNNLVNTFNNKVVNPGMITSKSGGLATI